MFNNNFTHTVLMYKKTHIVFLLLSFIALSLIGWDYVCGHLGENPCVHNNCLLCLAFQSTELGHSIPAFFLIFGLSPVIDYIKSQEWILPANRFLTYISLRAPPCSVILFV